MNILILNWRDPKHPLAGGAEISLLEHAKFWQRQGAQVTWFASSFDGAEKEEKIEGITYIRRGSHFTVHVFFLLSYLSGKVKSFDKVIDCFHFLPFFTPLYIKDSAIVALINEVAGKVWYSNMPYPLAWIGFHVEPLFFKVYKNIPFITASDSAKDDLVKVGVFAKNITIVPHGITVQKVSSKVTKEKDPTLLFLGRVSKDKGIRDVLEAFSEIRSQLSDVSNQRGKSHKQSTESGQQVDLSQVKLWIVGKEEKEGYLESLLATDYRHLKTYIKYYGFVTEKEKFELLKRSWLLLHASVKEGWGLTVIEANSQGTPTIGYNVEGLRDSIQHEKTGLLVEPNATSLAEGVIKILSDKAIYNSMSKNAKAWSESFDWEKSGEKSWKLIRNI